MCHGARIKGHVPWRPNQGKVGDGTRGVVFWVLGPQSTMRKEGMEQEGVEGMEGMEEGILDSRVKSWEGRHISNMLSRHLLAGAEIDPLEVVR